jgi:uncharacterized protein (DUF2384 family)
MKRRRTRQQDGDAPAPDSTVRVALHARIGDDAMARVIYQHLGETALDWLGRSIPALGGRTPEACLRTAKGRKLLRAVLQRFP